MDDNTNPLNPLSTDSSTMSDEQIAALVDSKAREKADEIATSKVEKLKEELAESLAGKKSSRYGSNGPESWDRLHEDIATDATERAVRAAEERIERRLADEKKAAEDEKKMSQKQIEEAQKAEYARMSAEWQEAVADGVLPDISSGVKEKLKSGVVYDDLSEEEKNDPGLKAYNEARMLHIKLKNDGKSNSFYRTASQFYGKQPAGAYAPVMGGAVSSPGNSSESDLSYEEVRKNRLARFGF